MTYKRWKKFKLPQLFLQYKTLRNAVNIEIRNSKRRFFAAKFNNVSSKKLWKNIKSLGITKTQKSAEDDCDINELNKQFVNSVSDTNGSVEFDRNFERSNELLSSFNFKRIFEVEVFKAVKEIKKDAFGLDNMHPKFIKKILTFISPFLTHIFNSILTTSCYPKLWKASKILPILKKSNSQIKEYRPISILPFISKAFEKIASQQITAFLETNKLIIPTQSGFRPKHSCTTALLKISDDIRQQIDIDHVTTLVLLDFSKAFDTVSHEILLKKLYNFFFFDNSALSLIEQYLSHRTQAVYSNSRLSEFLPTSSGVLQG